MATVERRIAYLEGKVEEQTHQIDGMREALASLEMRMDRRFETVDRRFDTLDTRLDRMEQRLDDRMSRQFLWLVGLQVTTLASMLAAFSALAVR